MPTALRRPAVRTEDPFTGWSAVHHDCVRRNHEALKVRLKRNPTQIDARTPEGETPMMMLAMGGPGAASTLSWAMNAFSGSTGWLHAQDTRGRTVMHHAAHQGAQDVMQVLLSTPLRLDLPDEHGNTALHLAARRGHASIVEQLVNAGASTSLRNHQGDTPGDLARAMNHTPCANALVPSRPMDPQTLLFDAVCTLGGDEEAITAQVQRALDRGASPNDADEDIPALHHAAHNGHLGATRLLLERGADLHARDDQGNTALTLVATTLSTQENTRDVAGFLIDQGADVRALNDHGVAPADMVRLALQQRPGAWLQTFADRCTQLEKDAARAELDEAFQGANIVALPSTRSVRTRL